MDLVQLKPKEHERKTDNANLIMFTVIKNLYSGLLLAGLETEMLSLCAFMRSCAKHAQYPYNGVGVTSFIRFVL
jgi:hypothetical protein